VIAQGDLWWADFPPPSGSEPGYRRPVLVVQSDLLNRSRIATVLCVPLSSNLKLAESPGNLLLPERETGLPKPSVANVSQTTSMDRLWLSEYIGRLRAGLMEDVLAGIGRAMDVEYIGPLR